MSSASALDTLLARARQGHRTEVTGSLVRSVGLALEGEGCSAAIGDRCEITLRDGSTRSAEVVGFDLSLIHI